MSELTSLKCPFCHPEEVVLENELSWARYDKFPVNPGHIFICRRHVNDFFHSTKEERHAINALEQPNGCSTINSAGWLQVGLTVAWPAGQTICPTCLSYPAIKGHGESPRAAYGVIPEKQILRMR